LTSDNANNQKAVEMVGITKAFGGVTALKDVDFAVRTGEIRGLVGENGSLVISQSSEIVK